MEYTKYVIVLFIILLSFCGRGRNSGSSFYQSPLVDKNLSLEKIDEFVIHAAADSGHTLGKIRFTFATNSAGSLHAFYDEMKQQFVVTDREGEIQELIGKEGRGPGEIVRAAGFDFDGQRQLIMIDDRQSLIKVFDLDGNIVRNSKIDKDIYSMVGRDLVAHKGKIYVGVIKRSLLSNLREEAHKSELAGIYNYDGALVDTVGSYDPTVKESKTYNLFSVINVDVRKEWLLGIQYHNYRMQLYDLDSGERLAWFGRQTENYITLDENISRYLPRKKIQEKSAGTSSAVRPYSMSDYIVLYFETLTKEFFETENFNAKEGYIAIYDNETYDSYGDIKLPYTLGNVANDNFYLIENDNPDNFTVGVYNLIIQ